MMNIPLISASSFYVPRVSHNRSLPTTQGTPPRIAGTSGPDSCEAFALVSGACETFCVPFKIGVSVSPSPMELLQSSLIGLQSHMLWGCLLPMLGPQAGEPDIKLRTLTSVGELL